MRYSEKMKRIQEIATELQQGNIEIDDAIKLFEESESLLKECEKILEEANGKFQELTADSNM